MHVFQNACITYGKTNTFNVMVNVRCTFYCVDGLEHAFGTSSTNT